VIVGTALKRGGITTNPVDPARVREFMAAVPR
jgi:predicted TIM-barrel enzyme